MDGVLVSKHTEATSVDTRAQGTVTSMILTMNSLVPVSRFLAIQLTAEYM